VNLASWLASLKPKEGAHSFVKIPQGPVIYHIYLCGGGGGAEVLSPPEGSQEKIFNYCGPYIQDDILSPVLVVSVEIGKLVSLLSLVS